MKFVSKILFNHHALKYKLNRNLFIFVLFLAPIQNGNENFASQSVKSENPSGRICFICDVSEKFPENI